MITHSRLNRKSFIRDLHTFLVRVIIADELDGIHGGSIAMIMPIGADCCISRREEFIMPVPTRCLHCGSAFPLHSFECANCGKRYGFDVSLAPDLLLRYGPFLVRQPGSGELFLVCLARNQNNSFFLQAVRWQTGELLSPVALGNSSYPHCFPANRPVANQAGRVFVPLALKSAIACLLSPIERNLHIIPLKDGKRSFRPIVCLVEPDDGTIIVLCNGSEKTHAFRLDLNLQLSYLGQLASLKGADRDVILMSDQHAYFRPASDGGQESWYRLNVGDLQPTPLAVPSYYELVGPDPVQGIVAFTDGRRIELLSLDGVSSAAFDLPAPLDWPTTIARGGNGVVYVGTYQTGSDRAGLYYPANKPAGAVQVWLPLPSRPLQIVLDDRRQQAWVLTHSRYKGTNLVSVDLRNVSTQTVVGARQRSSDCLVLAESAVAFGSGNLIYKRPVYRDDEIPLIPEIQHHPEPPIRPFHKISPTPEDLSPSDSPRQQHDEHGSLPSRPPLEVIVEPIIATKQVEVGSQYPLDLRFTSVDRSRGFRVMSVLDAQGSPKGGPAYSINPGKILNEPRSQHTVSLQVTFLRTGVIRVRLNYRLLDEGYRPSSGDVQCEYKVVYPRPSGDTFTASGDMVVIKRG